MENKLGGHTNSYHTYSLDEALEGIAASGFKSVELSAVRGWTEHVSLDSTDADLQKLQDKLKIFGLEAMSLSGHSDLTKPEGLERGKKALDLCHKLGITIMNTAIGGHYSEKEDEEAFLRHIGELADYAEERGVTVALEIHGEIMATGALTVPLMAKIARPNIRVNYDTANVVFYGGKRAVEDLPHILPWLAHVHLKDTAGGCREWCFPPLGQGHVDFKAILDILGTAGYKGPLSVEIEFYGEPWPPLEEVNRAMKISYEHLKGLGLS